MKRHVRLSTASRPRPSAPPLPCVAGAVSGQLPEELSGGRPGKPDPRIRTVGLLRARLSAICWLPLLLPVLSIRPGAAETFPVSDVSGFQSALDDAASNGEDDLIQVAAGTYLLTVPLTYSSSEGRSLTISGAGVGATVLDGQDLIRTLALSTATGDVVVEDLRFTRGAAPDGDGGALRLDTGSGDLVLRDCEVTDSAVSGESVGGGASLFTDSGEVTVSGCAFRRNTSEANVGGLLAATTTGAVLLEGSVFEDNSVDNLGGQSNFGDGGGAMIYADDGGQATVRSSSFLGNTTDGGDNPDGGGLMIYLLGTGAVATVESSAFAGNTAGLGGGGLFVRINGSGSITVRGNELTGNTATLGEGGGAFLYLDTGILTLEDNTAASNGAGTDGGGLWVSHTAGTATISGNRFDENEAGSHGGGLHLGTDTATVGMSGNAFWSNSAGGVGGGFSYATGGGALELDRTTTHLNEAAGGAGIYLYLDQAAAPTTLGNLVLWGDLPDELGFSSGRRSAPRGGALVEVLYSNVEGGTGQPWLGEGSIDQDPLFGDGAVGDLSLSWPGFPSPSDPGRSPCIDAGDPTSDPDPDGSRADMGAYSFEAAGFVFADGFESGDTSGWP